MLFAPTLMGVMSALVSGYIRNGVLHVLIKEMSVCKLVTEHHFHFHILLFTTTLDSISSVSTFACAGITSIFIHGTCNSGCSEYNQYVRLRMVLRPRGYTRVIPCQINMKKNLTPSDFNETWSSGKVYVETKSHQISTLLA